MQSGKVLSVAGAALASFLVCSPAPSMAENLRLYVGNSRGDDISVVDMTTFKVVGDIKLGDRIHGVCIQPDGKRLFGTVESDHTLRIIDTSTQNTLATVKVDGRPNQCAVTPNGKYVAVPIRDGDKVDIVDVAKHEIVKSLPIKEPHNALSTESNRYIYISAMSGHEIDVIDLEKMDYSEHIPVDGRPRPYVVSRDGETLFVAVADLHGFEIVDIPAKKVVQRFEMPAEHPTPHPLKYESADTRTHGLALTPDGSELWVSSLLDDCVYVYEVKSRKIVSKVTTGEGPNWLAFTPDGKYLAVSNADSDDVSIIDVKNRREVTRVKVGKAPKRLAVAIAP